MMFGEYMRSQLGVDVAPVQEVPRSYDTTTVEGVVECLVEAGDDVLISLLGQDYKSVWRQLARVIHPDRCRDPRAHDAFLRLKEFCGKA